MSSSHNNFFNSNASSSSSSNSNSNLSPLSVKSIEQKLLSNAEDKETMHLKWNYVKARLGIDHKMLVSNITNECWIRDVMKKLKLTKNQYYVYLNAGSHTHVWRDDNMQRPADQARNEAYKILNLLDDKTDYDEDDESGHVLIAPRGLNKLVTQLLTAERTEKAELGTVLGARLAGKVEQYLWHSSLYTMLAGYVRLAFDDLGEFIEAENRATISAGAEDEGVLGQKNNGEYYIYLQNTPDNENKIASLKKITNLADLKMATSSASATAKPAP